MERRLRTKTVLSLSKIHVLKEEDHAASFGSQDDSVCLFYILIFVAYRLFSHLFLWLAYGSGVVYVTHLV